MTPAQIATLDAAAVALELNVDGQLASEVRAIAQAGRTTLPPLRWKSTTICFTRFITDERYRKLRPSLRRWYEPVCPDCGSGFRLAVHPAAPADLAVPSWIAQQSRPPEQGRSP